MKSYKDHHSHRSVSSQRWSLILANLLEHFDSSLYGFLAPLLGKTFFPEVSPLYQLILTYGVYLITFVGRPLGGLYFSKLTYRYNSFHILIVSLIGVALSTGLMGILPGPSQIGILAPCLLVIVRFIQSFCAAGESAIAGYFLLEKTTQERQISWSSFYQSSTVIGILIASYFSTYILANYPDYWRVAFLLGFFLGIWALGMRLCFGINEPEKLYRPFNDDKILPRLKIYRHLIFALVPIYGFSYLTYSFPLVFLNPYLALISPTPLSTLMEQTNSLLWLDALLFPAVAFCIHRLCWHKVMMWSAILFLLSASVLLIFLYQESVLTLYLLRFFLVAGGVSFAAALIPWTASLFPPHDKYLLHSVSYNLGSELFGRSTPFICFWLYGLTNTPSSPLIYVFGLAILSIHLILGLQMSRTEVYAKT